MDYSRSRKSLHSQSRDGERSDEQVVATSTIFYDTLSPVSKQWIGTAQTHDGYSLWTLHDDRVNQRPLILSLLNTGSKSCMLFKSNKPHIGPYQDSYRPDLGAPHAEIVAPRSIRSGRTDRNSDRLSMVRTLVNGNAARPERLLARRVECLPLHAGYWLTIQLCRVRPECRGSSYGKVYRLIPPPQRGHFSVLGSAGVPHRRHSHTTVRERQLTT